MKYTDPTNTINATDRVAIASTQGRGGGGNRPTASRPGSNLPYRVTPKSLFRFIQRIAQAQGGVAVRRYPNGYRVRIKFETQNEYNAIERACRGAGIIYIDIVKINDDRHAQFNIYTSDTDAETRSALDRAARGKWEV